MAQFTNQSVHIYFVIDVSGSMNGHKIEQVNAFMEEMLAEIKNICVSYIPMWIHVLAFGDRVRWFLGKEDVGIPVSSTTWKHLNATGKCTDTAKALNSVFKSICIIRKSENAKNIVLLITDGKCTEPENVYIKQRNDLKAITKNNGVCMAVEVEGADVTELKKFASKIKIGDGKMIPLIYSLRDSNSIASVIQQECEKMQSDKKTTSDLNDWVG